jgi:hypothetical protein
LDLPPLKLRLALDPVPLEWWKRLYAGHAGLGEDTVRDPIPVKLAYTIYYYLYCKAMYRAYMSHAKIKPKLGV